MNEARPNNAKFQLGVVRALAEALEAKDPYTAGHSRRVATSAVTLAQALQLPEDVIRRVQLAANLHDVGKIGVAEAILHKPGPLTPAEWRQIEQHPLIGANILEPLELDSTITLGVKHHHERFDGTGYPCRLCGTGIPLASRVLQVADAWDAMTSDRPYRRALPPQVAVDALQAGAGSQFDPELVEVYGALVAAGSIRVGETRLLVLTDDPEALLVLRLCQDGQGLRVLALDTDTASVEAVVAHQPDVIVVDTEAVSVAPDRFYDEITSDPRTERVPVILMVSNEQVLRSVEQSAAAIKKPLVRGEVEARVRTVLRDAATRPRNAPSRPIRLVLADDHTMFREGLRQLLDLEEGIEVIGEAKDGVDAEAIVSALSPDVVVMDINMPHRDGIQTTRAIRSVNPRAKIVLLTMHQQDAFVQDARAAGAMGYLLKNASAREIIQAIRSVTAGNAVYPTLPKAC
ncbi:MAG: response regulator [Thermomicrobiales bacterium]|nr:response regulator [Thermomicrobiales bacterium]